MTRNFFDMLSKKNIKLYTIIIYGLVLLVGVLVAYYFMPILLNYGPNTINTEFDKTFSSGLMYWMQFALIYLGLFSVEALWLLYEMREFTDLEHLKEKSQQSKEYYEKYLHIVQKCFIIPKLSFIFIVLAPTFAVACSFIFLKFTSFADFKVLFVVLILSLIDGTLTFIVSKRIFKRVLTNILNLTISHKGRLTLTPSIIFQVTPIAVICVIFTFFLSYSNNLNDKSIIAQKHYDSTINELLSKSHPTSISELEDVLVDTSMLYETDKISLMDNNDTIYSLNDEQITVCAKVNKEIDLLNDDIYFYDTTNDIYYLKNNSDLVPADANSIGNSLVIDFSEKYLNRNKQNDHYTNINFNQMDINDEFFYTYARDLASFSNNRIYGYYGSEIQGTIIPVKIGNEVVNVVVMYDLSDYNVKSILINLFVILLISVFVTYNFARSIARDVSTVTDGIEKLLKGDIESLNKNLPVTSNDELGELVIAFNKVQELTKENIVEIKNNEQMLMEKERLASLGELIGGIAHNMKTPIMSISGAAEGLIELISEYRASIDNPIVTPDDHKEIANDMLDWVTKIKSHTQYMSDIITTVKGQASQLASTEAETFTVYDLSKRVEILIKHEIKKALLRLNADIHCDPSIKIHGDINNLIQVISNLISNSIYAYKGVPDQNIDFVIDADDENIIITVSDKGMGMNEETKSKLFKQMYTTKGKEGTGLGLYMSYSTIRGKFNGNMSFESEEGKGTTFTITIPRKN